MCSSSFVQTEHTPDVLFSFFLIRTNKNTDMCSSLSSLICLSKELPVLCLFLSEPEITPKLCFGSKFIYTETAPNFLRFFSGLGVPNRSLGSDTNLLPSGVSIKHETGHLIPMVDMAKLIAQQSVAVTIVITPRNAQRYGAVLDRAVASGLPIHILQLPFSPSQYGLPDGCESLDDLPTLSLFKNFIDASGALQQPLEEVFGELKPRPSCIICEKSLRWTADFAGKFQIPRVIFDGTSCFTQLCVHKLCVSKIHERVADSEPFILPGFTESIAMTKSQLPGLLNPGKGANAKATKILHEQIRETESGAYGILINSFDELERRYIDEYRKVKQDKVWAIGPFSHSNKNDLDKAQRGSNVAIKEHDCMISWLDSQPQGSVIYACLGSLTRVTPPHFKELALGLEESGSPFILVVKGGSRPEEMEKWLAEDGFEERVKGRGVLVRRWAPQVLILSHPAVGAFLTHCGWNSTLEGFCAGVPMITWPHFAEQFFNERFAVQVGTGVAVGAQRVIHVGEEDAAEVQVRREDVCKAAKTIMDQGREGEERRQKAKYVREMAEKALEDGGSSQLNLKLFIEDIRQHTNKGLAG